MHLLDWGSISRLKIDGGVSIRDLKFINRALIAKLCWRFLTEPKSVWVLLLKAKYLKERAFWNTNHKGKSTTTWKGMTSMKDHISKSVCWVIGNGAQNIPLLQTIFSPAEVDAICLIRLSRDATVDRIIWTKTNHGLFSTQSSYSCILAQQPSTSRSAPDFPWKKFWTIPQISPRIHMFMWRLISNGLPLKSNIGRFLPQFDKICVICGEEDEELNHLFLKCRTIREFWFLSPIGLRVVSSSNWGN
ncbi:Reverse transcriptase zinc-binding domain [Macleaya cordata]|uniref:Reverse transcriptase zinc-binding domain n=1 Tax=Macleaya cordata TaxID=56857 RepID=A0A200RAE2_MACCD|nr:Reverse transcriptase zinc-binding domain [Macleaya cordata]